MSAVNAAYLLVSTAAPYACATPVLLTVTVVLASPTAQDASILSI